MARGGRHIIRLTEAAYQKVLEYAARHKLTLYQAASELIAAAKVEPQPEKKGGVMAEMARLKEINMEEAKHVRHEPKPRPEREPAPGPAGAGGGGGADRPGGGPAGDDTDWWEE